VNAIGIHSPELIGFIGYEWNFQDHDRSDAAPGRRLALAMFSNINIFHGNAGYFSSKLFTVNQLVWWMHNPDQIVNNKNVRPVELISKLALTVDNYKDRIAEIWMKIEKGGWK
jgi:hypothetical protein